MFYLAVIGAIAWAIDANTRDSLGTFLIVAPIWLALAGLWAVRFLAAAVQTSLRMPVNHWLRWLVVPVAMGLVFFVTRTDALFQARFDLSRPALDQMAAEVMAGGSAERGWVGLYDVGDVERLENGLRFEIDDSGLYRLGFAYSPDGEPAQSTEEDYGLWTGAWFEDLGGGWWLWTEEWD